MLSESSRPHTAATWTAQHLLRSATATANPSKKLLHRFRNRLQAPKSDVTIATTIDHVDSIDARSLEVLQALLQLLESQVSIEKCQAVESRLLVIAARRGHVEILDYLQTKISITDYSHGEALEMAVLHGHIACVEILLKKAPSVHNVERALLVTDFLNLDQAREIIKLLLDFQLPHCVLEYLTLKMYALSDDEQDDEVLGLVLEARNRDSSQLGASSNRDSDSLNTYFEIQNEVRRAYTHKRASSSLSGISAMSVPVAESRGPSRHIFGDETIRDSENVTARLMERYLTSCFAMKSIDTPWPLDIIDLFLQNLPDGAEELPEYGQSLHLAVSSQQTTVFSRLLNRKPKSVKILRTSQLREIIRNVEMTSTLVDCLNEHYTGDEFYPAIIECLFFQACRACNFPVALQICSRSRFRVSILPVREYLKTALAFEEHVGDVGDLLKIAHIEEGDFDVLWDHVLSTDKPSIHIVRMLLQAGYQSPLVAKTFLKWVRLNEEIPVLAMILEEWRIDKSTKLREGFDYQAKEAARPRESGLANDQSQYFSTLAAAMNIAIERQQPDICRLLLSYGAPATMAGESLLTKAVRYGKGLTLGCDEVLKLILDRETKRVGDQTVLDYALVQAVKYTRPRLVAELINQGASTTAHKYECWRVIFQSKDETMLRTFLANSKAALELSKQFMAIFASFAIDPKVWLTLCGQLHQIGYVNPKCYSWVLSVLCLHNKATAESAKQLLDYGASARDELDESIEQCWLHSNLPVFRLLVKNGIGQKTAEALFQSMTRILLDHSSSSSSTDTTRFETSRSAIILDAMELLLQQDIPGRLKDASLCILSVSHKILAVHRLPVLKSLLKKGARFSEEDGLALLHCIFIDDEDFKAQVHASRPPLKARQEALRFALHFPSEMGDPAPSQRFSALAQLLYPIPSAPGIKLSDQTVLDVTGIFLSPNSDTPTTLIHHFYGWLRNRSPSGLSDLEHCWAVEKKLNTIFEGLADCKDQKMQFIERITAVLAWTRPEPESAISSARYFDSFWLPRTSLSRYLIEAAKAGLTPIVGALLEAGVSPNVYDESGKSALFCAASKGEPTVVLLLIDAGADLDDGSLHEAMCQQHAPIMELLLKVGHSRTRNSPLHDDTTPLLAFVQFDHKKSDVDKFNVIVNQLLRGQQFTPDLCKDLKAAVVAATTNRKAFQLILAFVPWLRKSFDAQREIFEAPIARGPLRYSLLSLIDRWEYNCLSRDWSWLRVANYLYS